VHVRHVLGSGPGLIAESKKLELPVVFSFHDYATLCPTVHLLDERGEFCGGRCTPGEGPCRVSPRWFKGLPPIKHAFVHVWRERLAEQLKQCDAFITTSQTANDLIGQHYPFLRERPFHIIEHGRDSGRYEPSSVPPAGRPVRVACFGALGRAKGIDLLSQVMQIDLEEGPRFEFHFYGTSSFQPERLGGIVHGPYERGSLPSLLGVLKPSWSIIMSTTYETYCHTLTESWMCGLPAFVADIGTLRERTRREGGGWLLDYRDPRLWYEAMANVTPDDWRSKRAEIDQMQFRSVDEMALEYRDIYRSLIGTAKAPDIAV
jgi:glycosyltransferase involved in cell wall biosynthesis